MRYGMARLLRRKPPVRWIAIADDDTDGRWWIGLTRDVLYAWRAITQRPALAAVVVLTLAVALAANSTTFSLMDALVLRPYRFAGVDRLLVVTTARARRHVLRSRERVGGGLPRMAAARPRRSRQWALYQWWDANLSGVDIPEQVAGFRVSPGYFALLGVTPALGREFIEDEAQPGQHRRVVLGHALWQRRFAAIRTSSARWCVSMASRIEVVGVAPAADSTFPMARRSGRRSR